MLSHLTISVGQCSDKGRKATNQDFHGVCVPEEPLLSSKGVCVALADGISSSAVSQVASEAAVKTFLQDYYCTSDAWSVRGSAQRVLGATNSWLHAQTRRSPFRYEADRGYVCTFSGMVIKSTTAHLFHAGDARIYRVLGERIEQLTVDHRLRVSDEVSYLSRALGADAQLELDYRAVPVARGHVFVLATDGVYEHASEQSMVDALQRHGADLDAAAQAIVAAAYDNGSGDNLTVQVVRVDDVPSQNASEALRTLSELPFPPALQPRMSFDGYRIVREIHATHRSRVYHVTNNRESQQALEI